MHCFVILSGTMQKRKNLEMQRFQIMHIKIKLIQSLNYLFLILTGEREQELVQIGTKTEKVPYTVQADTFSGGLTIPGLNSGVEFELENWELKTIKWGQIFAAASERNDVRIFSTPSITVIHGGGEDDEKGGSKSSKIQIKEQRHFGTSSYYDYRSAPGADMTGDDANSRWKNFKAGSGN